MIVCNYILRYVSDPAVAEMWKHGPPDKESAWPDMLTLLVDDFGIDPDQPDMDAPEQQETALFWALEAHSGPQASRRNGCAAGGRVLHS